MSIKNAINKYGKKFVTRYTQLRSLEDPVENLILSVELSEYISNWTEEQKDNKDLVRIVFLKTFQGWQLKDVSDRLKNDKDVVIEAIQSDVASIPHIGDSLQDDDEIIELITNPIIYLNQISGFISDPEGFGNPDEMALKYAPSELLASKEFREMVFKFTTGYSKILGQDPKDLSDFFQILAERGSSDLMEAQQIKNMFGKPIDTRILAEIFMFFDQGEDVLQYKELIVQNSDQKEKTYCVFKTDNEGNRYGQFLDGTKIKLI